MTTTKKNSFRERYLSKYRPFSWSLGPKEQDLQPAGPRPGENPEKP